MATGTRSRIQKLEERMNNSFSAEARFDSEGWRLIGGGRPAHGVLRVPPIQSVKEWEEAPTTVHA